MVVKRFMHFVLRTQCVHCFVCLYLIICSESLVMIIACEMFTMFSLHRVITKSLLSTSFSIACPSVSEIIGFLGNPRSNKGNWCQSLVLRFTLHLGGIKYYLYNIKCKFKLYLLSTLGNLQRRNKNGDEMKVYALTCVNKEWRKVSMLLDD